MLFRRPLFRHRCFSAKSASGNQPYVSLADSSQGLAWWCWMQAFVACGLSNPTCAFWSLSQLGFVSSCPTVVCLRQLQAVQMAQSVRHCKLRLTWCWARKLRVKVQVSDKMKVVVSSSSSAFPSYISGVHHFGVRFLHMWPFCNPTIKVVTFCLRGWCMLGVFLLPAFTRLGHERQDLLSPCDEMHVCTD